MSSLETSLEMVTSLRIDLSSGNVGLWSRYGKRCILCTLLTDIAHLSGAFDGLLASGILKLSHFGSLRSWQMYVKRFSQALRSLTYSKIFAIEGILTMGVALVAFFTLTDRPETARWLSEEQKQLTINHVKSERLD